MVRDMKGKLKDSELKKRLRVQKREREERKGSS